MVGVMAANWNSVRKWAMEMTRDIEEQESVKQPIPNNPDT